MIMCIARTYMCSNMRGHPGLASPSLAFLNATTSSGLDVTSVVDVAPNLDLHLFLHRRDFHLVRRVLF